MVATMDLEKVIEKSVHKVDRKQYNIEYVTKDAFRIQALLKLE